MALGVEKGLGFSVLPEHRSNVTRDGLKIGCVAPLLISKIAGTKEDTAAACSQFWREYRHNIAHVRKGSKASRFPPSPHMCGLQWTVSSRKLMPMRQEHSFRLRRAAARGLPCGCASDYTDKYTLTCCLGSLLGKPNQTHVQRKEQQASWERSNAVSETAKDTLQLLHKHERSPADARRSASASPAKLANRMVRAQQCPASRSVRFFESVPASERRHLNPPPKE